MHFMRQAEKLGLGRANLCTERALGYDPFAVLLVDDFCPIANLALKWISHMQFF
jgi:UTP-glucose-1-phosphate uridylyltransferase